MIALDTNILVHAHREESPWHRRANDLVTSLAEGTRGWAIPWPVVYEFLAIVTHPRVWKPPSPLEVAFGQMEAWRGSPTLKFLADSPGLWATLERTLAQGQVIGPRVHDGRIAALCLHHGIDELWTADRDFGRFPWLKVRNPLVS